MPSSSPRRAALAVALACGIMSGQLDTSARAHAADATNATDPRAAPSHRQAAALQCPPESALVAVNAARHVCLDVYEAALKVNGSAWPYNLNVDGLPDGAYVAYPANGVKPQAYISEMQGAAACAAGSTPTFTRRLCTLEEWLAGCQGPDKTTYPYGNTYHSGWCNEGRPTNPVNDVYGPHATFNTSEMNNPVLDTLPRTVAPGGEYARCVSYYGAYDMHGGMHEWIDATTSKGTGIFKGGFFVDAKINGPGCLYATTAHGKGYHDYSNGFRCCADPAPAVRT